MTNLSSDQRGCVHPVDYVHLVNYAEASVMECLSCGAEVAQCCQGIDDVCAASGCQMDPLAPDEERGELHDPLDARFDECRCASCAASRETELEEN